MLIPIKDGSSFVESRYIQKIYVEYLYIDCETIENYTIWCELSNRKYPISLERSNNEEKVTIMDGKKALCKWIEKINKANSNATHLDPIDILKEF